MTDKTSRVLHEWGDGPEPLRWRITLSPTTDPPQSCLAHPIWVYRNDKGEWRECVGEIPLAATTLELARLAAVLERVRKVIDGDREPVYGVVDEYIEDGWGRCASAVRAALEGE